MNTNEVVANLALEKIGHKKGEYNVINPMDHVNASQSTMMRTLLVSVLQCITAS